MSDDDQIPLSEVAAILGVSRSRVDQYVRTDRLPVEWVGPIRVCRRGAVAELKQKIRPRGAPRGPRPKKERSA